MKILITEADLNKIVGHFTIQLNSEGPHSLKERGIDLNFYLIKRIRFISYSPDYKNIQSSDLFGNTLSYPKEKYVEMFNEYLGESKGTRYHRLLHAEELPLVFEFISKHNY